MFTSVKLKGISCSGESRLTAVMLLFGMYSDVPGANHCVYVDFRGFS